MKNHNVKISRYDNILPIIMFLLSLQVEDFGQSTTIYCYFAIAPDAVILVEEGTNEVVFTVPCRSVIGWTSTPDSLRIYYDHGECVVLRVTCTEPDEVLEIVNRLSLLTQGCEVGLSIAWIL